MLITVTHCTTSKESVYRIVCMLCQQTSPKRWFANVNMTSYCDVTNSVYAVTMTTIRHCSMWEFGYGAYNHEVAPGITRPLHRGGPNGGRLGRSPHLKPTKVSFFTTIFYNSEKKHSRYKAILPSILLSQQYCEVKIISLTVAKPLWSLTNKCYWNRPP